MAQRGPDIYVSGGGIAKYPAKLHARNAAHHLEVSEGLIYLPGQHKLYIEDSDMTYPFRQRRYFYYLSGVNEPDCYMTYDIEQDLSTLYIAPITIQGVIWFGRGSTIEEAEERYDFDIVRFTTSMPANIEHWLLANLQKKVYVLRANQDLKGFLPVSLKPNYDMESLLPALDASRVIKDHDEIDLMRRAIKVSSLAHRTVMHHITSMKSEAEVHGLFLDVCIAHGASWQAYPPIVASGTNASILHYTDNNESLKGKSLLCLDAGCEWECYSSDITRTFPLVADGWPSKEVAEIYAIVEEMQERCIAMLGPGVRYLDAFYLADRIAIEGLVRLGILRRGNVEELLRAGVGKAFFPHGLGHHMGLDVHDVSANPILSFRRGEEKSMRDHSVKSLLSPANESMTLCRSDAALLEPGMVITVEPGIYFSRYALQTVYLPNPQIAKFIDEEVLERYTHVGGVRIEDDILITKHGHENLTMTPKGKEMLDIVRDGAGCHHGIECRFRLDAGR